MRGLGIVSWIIVFVPFMLMSTVTAILLYVFGFDPTTGKLKYYTSEDNVEVVQDARQEAAQLYGLDGSKSQYARPIDLPMHPTTSVSKQSTHSEPEPIPSDNNIVSQNTKQNNSLSNDNMNKISTNLNKITSEVSMLTENINQQEISNTTLTGNEDKTENGNGNENNNKNKTE